MSPQDQFTDTTTPQSPATGGDNIVDLLRQLTRQASHLAEQQLALVQAEVRESASDVKTAVVELLGAAVVGIAGLGVLLMGIAYLVGDAIDNVAWGTLIVGVVTVVIAYVLYSAARKKMDATSLAPDRTRRTLERTPDAVRGDLHTEQKP